MGKIMDISHHQGDIDWSKASKEVDLLSVLNTVRVLLTVNTFKTLMDVKSTRCRLGCTFM